MRVYSGDSVDGLGAFAPWAQRRYWRLIQNPAAEKRGNQQLTEPSIDTRIRPQPRQERKHPDHSHI
jgi:hypothetical protein